MFNFHGKHSGSRYLIILSELLALSNIVSTLESVAYPSIMSWLFKTKFFGYCDNKQVLTRN